MVRRARHERKVEFWKESLSLKVNGVHSCAQGRQHNPVSIGYCMSCATALRADTKKVSRRSCKVECWRECPIGRQTLQRHSVNISLQLRDVIDLGYSAGTQCCIARTAGAGWDQTGISIRLRFYY